MKKYMKKYLMTKILVVIMLCLITYPAFSVEEMVVVGYKVNNAAILAAMQAAFKAYEAAHAGTHQQDDPSLGNLPNLPIEPKEPCEEEAGDMADAADELAAFIEGNSTLTYDQAMALIEGIIMSGVTNAGFTQVVYMSMISDPDNSVRKAGFTQVARKVQKLTDAIDAYSECMESSAGEGAE